MTTYRAAQDISISGFECGSEIEISMVVAYTMTKYYPASNDGPEELPQPEIYTIRFFRKHETVNVEIDLPSFIAEEFTESEDFMSWLSGEANDAAEYQRDCAAEALAEDMRHA